MEHLLNPRVKNVQISGIRQFSNRQAQVPDAISFTLGQPDFPTPEHVRIAAVEALQAGHIPYTHNAGLLSLRKAAVSFAANKYGLTYAAEDEVIVTIGASEAIDVALRTILTEGCEVVLPGPIYPGYEPVIRMCGAKVLHIDTSKNGFQLTADLLRPYLSEKTRCVVLPYPSNPTGVSLSKDQLRDLAELLGDRDLFVLSDEIYSELEYDQDHTSIASFPGMRERTLVINGLSKSHAMTGWRIGLLYGPREILQHILKVHQYNVTCASTVSQYAAIEALTHGANDAEPMREEYRWRRDYAWERLLSMGIPTIKPDGAFYLFPEIRRFGLSSWDFATRLLEEGKVAVVPGDAFGRDGEGFIRLSYACSRNQLREGLDRMERFIGTFSR